MSIQSRPNILFIMTDQQRFDAQSGHGGLAQTPNLDALARSGVDFHGFFSNAPVCVPSRCSLFSGQYTLTHGILENDKRLPSDAPFLPASLKAAGYRLGYFGKNHLLAEGDERIGLFDRFEVCDSPDDVEPDQMEARRAFLRYRKQRGSLLATKASWASADFHDFPEEVTTPHVLRHKALEFIGQATGEQPFCLVMSFADPHVPHVAPKRLEATHPPGAMPIPEYPPETFENKAPRYAIKRIAQGSDDATDDDKRRYIAVYHAMISWIDENVGAVLDYLKDAGLSENTIVAFTSDHGDFAFHWGMCKKDLDLVDHLLHVPGILSWPGHLEPRIVPLKESMVESIDLFPSLLDLAGIEVPSASEGRSLKPFLLGQESVHKSVVYGDICYPDMKNPYRDYGSFIADWEKYHDATEPHLLRWTARFNVPGDHNRCVRTREWKYIWYHDDHEELYHVAEDPEEFHNLATAPAHADTLARMRILLHEPRGARAAGGSRTRN